MSGRDPTAPPLRLVVRLTSGQTLHAETAVVRGDAANPVDRSVLLDKFRFLAGQRCAEPAVRALEDTALNIDAAADV